MGRKKTLSDEDLLNVARKVFVEVGFAASTKEIARLAGVSESLIFQRFATKEDLFFAAMIPPAANLSDLFHHSQLKGSQLIEQVVLALTEYFRLTLPLLISLMSHPSFRFEDFAAQHPESSFSTLRNELVGFVIREQVKGTIGKVDPGATALQLWAAAHTVAFLEHLGAYGGHFPESFLRGAVDCMWQGLDPMRGKEVDAQ